MSNLLTVAQLREHITTGLGDEALLRYIDAEEDNMVARLGPIGEFNDLRWPRDESIILLGRAPATVTSVTEYSGLTDEIVLDPTDYYIDGAALRRRNDSTAGTPFPYWRSPVRVLYTPADDTNRRTLALIQLVALDVITVDSNAVLSRRVGEHWIQYRTPDERKAARAEIWNDLENAKAPLFA